MSEFEFTHRRKNPLTGDWVLVSPHRNNRPWLGATEDATSTTLATHDDSCPLCPRNSRANGETNPDYETTLVFTNDFGAITKDHHPINDANDELFQTSSASGECRVVCFSPDHSKTLPELTVGELLPVIHTWRDHYRELSQQYANVHIFENKGDVMGCSQPHPHGQIWAHDHQSTEIAQENERQQAYFEKHQRTLLGDYCAKEIKESNESKDGSRVVAENAHWLVVVPFWAAWPFETLVIAKGDLRQFGAISDAQSLALAEILKLLTTKYDNIFNCSFPYSMGWHSAPSNLQSDQHWRVHAHFYPPLLRSATVKKHMVGYEMLAESQRDLSAETAAQILQKASAVHYKQGSHNV